MAVWRFDWTISIEVGDKTIQRLEREDLLLAIREKLDELDSYAQLIGIKVEKKSINQDNPDINDEL